MNIQVIAPSACVDEAIILRSKEILKELDVDITLSQHIFAQYRYLAGTIDQRLNDLRTAMQDPRIEAVWCGRGGTGAAQLLPLLNSWTLAKPLIGYSDSTVLLNYIAMQGGQAIHGAVFQEISQKNLNDLPISQDGQEVLALLNPLFQQQVIHYSVTPLNHFAQQADKITAKVLGGNLTTLCTLQGTNWSLKLKEDAILMLEDVGEPFYRLERSLVQLLQSIDTSKLKAVVMGDFYNCPQKNVPHSLEEIFSEHLDQLNIPLYQADWFGHGEKNRPFWIGKNGSIHHHDLYI